VQKGQKLHKGRVYYINLLLERIKLRKIGKKYVIVGTVFPFLWLIVEVF